MTRICVVGAGPSGLTTTKTLLAAGLEVDCYELSPHIGGHWVIDNPSGRSSAYRSLRTNTTKRMSRFSDYEMPEDWDEFPSFDKVREWLEAYVDRFDFRKHIQTSTEIISAV
ncbi:MAG: NAD(P)-binding protein, partial [Henriciella sp.]